MFKEKIIEYRLQHGLTQEQLAENIGVSKYVIDGWENNNKLPNRSSLESLCHFFEINDSELLTEEELNKVINKNRGNVFLYKAIAYSYLVFIICLLTITPIFASQAFNDSNPILPTQIYLEYYGKKYVGLELGKEYAIDFSEIYPDMNIYYDECTLAESDFYTSENNVITPIKKGIFYVNFTLLNKKDNILYTGTALKVYCYDINKMKKINTVEDLMNIKNNKSGHYILNSNLDLKDVNNYIPIGDYFIDGEFSGVFINPNNYVIRNLSINTATGINSGLYGECLGGLFGNIQNAYIDNLILENVYIDVSDYTGKYYSIAGGIVGNSGNSLITNCKVSGTIIGQINVGGIAGSIGNSTLRNNTFKGTVVQKDGNKEGPSYSGGLVGVIHGCFENQAQHSGCEVTDNFVDAQIIAESISGDIAGLIKGDCVKQNNIA